MIERLLKSSIQLSKDILESNEWCRTALYDVINKVTFNSIYTHEMMIADKVRINSYYKAIRRYVKSGDIVVDLGTGTGILSLFSAQQNPKKIYAIDHSDFINIARKIARYNNINNITFVQTNSRDFKPIEKVDIILHEQLGQALFNENMIENILDLKKRILKETGKILPGKFELFLEPICLKEEYKIPYIWENNIFGLDFNFLKHDDEIEKYKPRFYENQSIEHHSIDHFLCEPQSILSFDLNKINDANEIPKFIEASKEVVQSGLMDGLCLYFKVIFDDEINFDTSPLHARTHWSNPLFRTESKHYNDGEIISFKLTMEDLIKRETWLLSIR
ncbi:50S ribosomal protein L11 methyltransferase [Methanosarcina mazei]|uniref:Ribosomal protein L11 methyltransferase n=1 Tax=Methanosarcina mazei SarPi TaxID=1434115 RepID=A0A0E3RB29_METMZ|nr:class I SAM-dependent methyltransferase [Methanosarcina mazei]AKB61542.1 ribosomal protein L11 methyltransferase [Methanosarcina mazei SarPi]